MTKSTHLLLGAGIGVLAGLNRPEIAILVCGTLFPDIVEKFLPRGFKHRGISHWGIAYGILVLLCYFDRYLVTNILSAWVSPLQLACFFGGCVIHWLADAYTYQGVPLLPGWRLQGPIRTGSLQEYAFLGWAIMIIMVVYQWQCGTPIFDSELCQAFSVWALN